MNVVTSQIRGTGSGIHAIALSGRTRILISVSESVENGVNMYVNHINSRPLLVFYDGGEDFVLRKCSNRHALVKTKIYHILPGDFCGPTNVGRARYIVSNERGNVGRSATWTRR